MSHSSENEQRNLERFTPLMYQLKKSGESNSPTHAMKCDVVGQEPGCYPYPKADQRVSPNENENGTEEEEDLGPTFPHNGCFKPKKLL
jgi:hypothetical protein